MTNPMQADDAAAVPSPPDGVLPATDTHFDDGALRSEPAFDPLLAPLVDPLLDPPPDDPHLELWAGDPRFEPPPDHDTTPEERLLSPYIQRQMLIGRLLDEAEVIDRQLAAASAARARAIAHLVTTSAAIAAEEQQEDTAKPPELRANRDQESGWSIRNRAKTELATEIAATLTLSTSAARHLIEESSTLTADLPLTLDALDTAAIRYEHAKAIASTAWTLPAEVRSAFEQEVLPWARTMILSAFRRKLLTVRERLHSTTLQERHEAAKAFRTVTLEPGEDGTGYLTIRDSNDVLAAIHNRITTMALPKAKDDPRTLAQRRTDIATEILLKGDLCDSPDENPTTGRTGRPLGHGIHAQVHITVPVLTLLGADTTPATLEGTIPIDPATARRLVADAPGFRRILTDPITGSIIAFDDTYRYLPKSLRRAVEHIDTTCTGPWCAAPATETDGHHPDEWAHSHNTSLDNSALLCPTDHKIIHNTRWAMTRLPNGDKQWISPSGRIHRVPPHNRLSPAFVEALKDQPDTDDTTPPPPATDAWNTPSDPNEEPPF